jgi:alanine dehydrogenase
VAPEVCICDMCVATCSEVLAEDEDTDAGAEDAPDREGADEEETIREQQRKRVFCRLLTEEDVAGLIAMDELIEAMAGALRRFSSGHVTQPVRTVLSIGNGRGFFGLMPAHIHDPAAVGAKLVSVVPGNAALDLPTHLATILLFSADTGALVAMMDGRYLTEVRTAAVSAVSARLLAPKNTAVMAIIGSGVQARSHLEAMEHLFELREVRVWSPTPEHREAFIFDMEPTTKATLVGSTSAEEAVRDADLVVLVTSSAEPVLRSGWVKDGAHVISVGACRPDQREMDPELTRRGRLFVDSRAAAIVESGDVVMAIAEGLFRESHIVGELGEVVLGTVEGRRWPHDVTIFKSLGLAVEDVTAADLVYQRALAQDVGQEIEF